MLWKCIALNMLANLENSAVATGLEKVSFHSNPKERLCKECWNYRRIAFISYASKIMLKILQARLQQYVNWNFQMFTLVLEKAEEPEIKLPTFAGSLKKQESYSKTSISALLTMPKPLTVENSERDENTRLPDLPLEKPVYQSGSNSRNWTQNNRLVPNRKRSTSRLYIVTLLIELICRVHHEKCWADRSTSWNQDCQEKY